MEYLVTQLVRVGAVQSHDVTDEAGAYEAALRRLPLPYSLALRLRDMGVEPSVVCEYLGLEETALDGFYRLAEEKLAAAW